MKQLIRIYLEDDPTVSVEIKTTQPTQKARLQRIRSDIQKQEFARWRPFHNRKWAYEVVEVAE
jgi:hypothetical protein